MAVIKELKLKDYATLLGTFCGFLALIATFGYGAYPYAFFFIFLSIAADFLDGFLARKMNQINALGKELDSLSDGFVFGVVPAIVAWKVLSDTQTHTGLPGYSIWLMLFPAFLFICGAILRLAWFNVAENEGYTGLPTPISAGFLALCLTLDYYVWAITSNTVWFNYFMHIFIPFFMIVMAWMNITDKISFGEGIRRKGGATKRMILINGCLIGFVAFMANFFLESSRIFIVVLLMGFWIQGFILMAFGFHTKQDPII